MTCVLVVRFSTLAAAGLSVVAVLAGQPLGQPLGRPVAAPGRDDVRPVGATTYPTNAAKVFRWGNASVKDEFKAPLTPRWSVNAPSQVRNQHGMLTLDATATGGDVTATLTGSARRYGRWEARVRGRQYGTAATPYRLVWELVPSDSSHCAARNIVVGDYTLGTDQASVHLRNVPDVDFTTSRSLPLSNNEFHTYAVEVAPDHISWFVDTRVIMTERRPAARTGASYSMRFRLVGKPAARMNPGRMQMDWARYYTLDRKNAQSITAPQASLGRFADAC